MFDIAVLLEYYNTDMPLLCMLQENLSYRVCS